MLVPLVGTTQRWLLEGAGRAFRRSVTTPETAQQRCFERIMRYCALSDRGRRLGLDRVTSLDEFRRAVPLVGYDDLVEDIELAAAGAPGVLSLDPIRAFELSSGSSGAQKLIPYGPALLGEFQLATSVWVHDLLASWPQVARTRHYWSISPGGARERTFGGIRVGLTDDTEYLGFFVRLATNIMLAVPGEVSRTESIAECRRFTAEALLDTPDLGFISVWSPTFLSLLFEQIEAEWGSLRRRVSRPLPDRFEPGVVWPALSLVSCWASGPSARLLSRLTDWIPGVEIQPKGLLATEGVISIPLRHVAGSVLAIDSHLLEFLEAGGRTRFAWELEVGETYEPLLSNASGLLRYRLGDRIRVVGHLGRTPTIEFVGRADGGSDLCGEKLSEGFVDATLRALDARGFAMLAPELTAPPRYVLWTDTPLAPEALERGLRQNPHYDRCRALGQLDPVRVRVVTDGPARYEAGCISDGMKAGDIKPRCLSPRTDWSTWLD